MCPSMYSQDGQSISGSQDTLTGGAVPIHVLSRDGQSILGSQDTRKGGGGNSVCSAHPCTVPCILGSWDTLMGRECSVHVPIHVLSQDGQSISGSWDTLMGGGAVPIHVLSRDGQCLKCLGLFYAYTYIQQFKADPGAL